MSDQALNLDLNFSQGNPEELIVNLEQPNWPKSRGLTRYKELVRIAPEELPKGSVWLDIGPGENAKALQDLKRVDVKKVAISAHHLNLPSEIETHLGFFPSKHFTAQELGQMDLITDIYSAFSYSDNPVSVLAHQVSLLKVGGTLAIFTEREKIKLDETWFRLIDIIEPLMGVDLTFKSKEIYADANQTKELGLEIIVEKKSHTSVKVERFLEIFHEVVGRAKIKDTIWSPRNSHFEINSIHYS